MVRVEENLKVFLKPRYFKNLRTTPRDRISAPASAGGPREGPREAREHDFSAPRNALRARRNSERGPRNAFCGRRNSERSPRNAIWGPRNAIWSPRNALRGGRNAMFGLRDAVREARNVGRRTIVKCLGARA